MDGNLYTNMRDFIENTWGALCAEFNIKCPILFLSSKRFIEDHIDVAKTKEDPLLFISSRLHLMDTLCWAGISVDGKAYGPPIVDESKNLVVINFEYLLFLTLWNAEYSDDLFEYVALSLRHEMGHILDFKDLAKTYKTYFQYLKSAAKCQRENDRISKLQSQGKISDHEYGIRYDNGLFEKRANDIVKVNINRHLELYEKLETSMKM